MLRLFSILPIAILLGTSTSCKREISADSIDPQTVTFPIAIESKILALELALNPEQRQRGLMHRDELDHACGMLFVFEETQPMRFWMKNTRIALDVGYFGPDGKLKELHYGRPFDLSGMPSKSRNLKFVVELGAGEFARLGIGIGDRIDLQMVADSVRKSGYSPASFGLPDPDR